MSDELLDGERIVSKDYIDLINKIISDIKSGSYKTITTEKINYCGTIIRFEKYSILLRTKGFRPHVPNLSIKVYGDGEPVALDIEASPVLLSLIHKLAEEVDFEEENNKIKSMLKLIS